jgi:hypothetical protein
MWRREQLFGKGQSLFRRGRRPKNARIGHDPHEHVEDINMSRAVRFENPRGLA